MAESSSTWSPELADLFANILLLGKSMERLMDQALAPYNLTSQQWFVLAVIAKSAKGRPSLKEVARALNTSHQNIKAISINLEKRGFLTLERDVKDKRVTRLVATEMNQEFWIARDKEGKDLIVRVFRCIDRDATRELGIFVKRVLDDSTADQ